jgi:hypothetical protein
MFTSKWTILDYSFMVLNIFGGAHILVGTGIFNWLFLLYICIFSFVGNIMLFILYMMQILTRNAGCSSADFNKNSTLSFLSSICTVERFGMCQEFPWCSVCLWLLQLLCYMLTWYTQGVSFWCLDFGTYSVMTWLYSYRGRFLWWTESLFLLSCESYVQILIL